MAELFITKEGSNAMLLDQNGNPIGTPAVESAEGIAAAAVQETQQQLSLTRIVLNADELCEMKEARPRLEKEVALRPIDGTRLTVFLFSIDGMLNGQAMRGCLFAGECMMVTAKTFEDALRLAKQGLADTMELMREELAGRIGQEASAVMEGLERDSGGRRMRPSAPGQELKSLPKLNAMLQHKIAGLPWKW